MDEADHVMLERVRRDLRAAADPARAPAMQAYMKSGMPYLGVPMPTVRRIARGAERERPPSSAGAVAANVRTLWREATHREHRYAASVLADTAAARRVRDMSALPLYEEMIRTGAWWDHVDDTAHRVGDLLLDHRTEMSPIVLRWADDPDRWIRRAAIICQLGHRALTDSALLAATISANRSDPDFFLRKAIGWALREYGKTDPQWVRRFVAAHDLSPLSRREALRRLL